MCPRERTGPTARRNEARGATRAIEGGSRSLHHLQCLTRARSNRPGRARCGRPAGSCEIRRRHPLPHVATSRCACRAARSSAPRSDRTIGRGSSRQSLLHCLTRVQRDERSRRSFFGFVIFGARLKLCSGPENYGNPPPAAAPVCAGVNIGERTCGSECLAHQPASRMRRAGAIIQGEPHVPRRCRSWPHARGRCRSPCWRASAAGVRRSEAALRWRRE